MNIPNDHVKRPWLVLLWFCHLLELWLFSPQNNLIATNLWVWVCLVFAGSAETRRGHTEHHTYDLWPLQEQQPHLWEQTGHPAGHWAGQTGQTVAVVWKPSQTQTGSRVCALLDLDSASLMMLDFKTPGFLWLSAVHMQVLFKTVCKIVFKATHLRIFHNNRKLYCDNLTLLLSTFMLNNCDKHSK